MDNEQPLNSQEVTAESRELTIDSHKTPLESLILHDETNPKQQLNGERPAKTTIRISIANHILTEAEQVLAETGLLVNDAIRLFLSQVVMHQGIPYGGFKSGLKPKPLKHRKKDQKREFVLEDTNRELEIAKAKNELLYNTDGIPI